MTYFERDEIQDTIVDILFILSLIIVGIDIYLRII